MTPWTYAFALAATLLGAEPALGEAYAAMNPFSTARYEGVYGAINWTPVPPWAKFFFQLVFAGTAATIVPGAVAERIKFKSFLVFSCLLVAFAYPITGHSMTSAALGVLILWLGWFGFNPGSTMAAMNGTAIAHILVNTNLAAATGALGATLTAWWLLGKPDLSMILNGCLAGLVAITAPCAFVTIGAGALIGLIAGSIVVVSVVAFDKIKVDDPVGALSVHLVCGIWGTLALGLFYDNEVATNIAALATGLSRAGQTLVQPKGILAAGIFTFSIAFVFWYAIKLAMGLRVSEDEEIEGLDIGEHGNSAYLDFSTHPGSFGIGTALAAPPAAVPATAHRTAAVES